MSPPSLFRVSKVTNGGITRIVKAIASGVCFSPYFSHSSNSFSTVPEPWPRAQLPVEEADTPPSSWYMCASTLRKEERRVFHTSWQLVGRANQVEAPGSFFTGSLLRTRYLVVRGEDCVLRAFHNVCRHHAAAVANGSGECQRFVCPYHGWTYGLDGRLEKATKLAGIKDFRAKDNGLVPIRVQTWGHFVFAQLGSHLPNDNADACAPLKANVSLEEWLGEAGHVLQHAGMHHPLQFVHERTYDIKCNWKVVCDNYLDGGYHVPFAHKDLAAALELGSYRSVLYPNVSIQTTSTASESQPGERLGSAHATYAFIYPNIMLNRYGPWLDTNVVVPTAPDRCKVIFNYFLDKSNPSATDEAWVEASLKDSNKVQDEDTALCEDVQAGLESPAYDKGRYAPRLEHPMFHFHQQLHSDLTQ